ncbi:hypothetical protein BJV77DRAFT_1162251 [Russula vinacea]|nr:hypothetical protein BJV77DRAFT_1162251 [Russula vinacea]
MTPTREEVPLDAGAILVTTLLNAMARQFPSSQEKRGDDKLELARDITNKFRSVIAEDDKRTIEDKITLAREMKEGLDSKSGISRLKHARGYRRACRDAYRHAMTASQRGRDEAQFHHQLDDSHGRVVNTAQALYRCRLSCRDAFPSPDLKKEWATEVWNEACAKEAYPDLSRQDEEFVISSLVFFTDIKADIKHAVESSYGFDTSRAPDIISRNASRAQTLLTNLTFIYQDPNLGGSPHFPYRNSIIQRAINLTWFEDKEDDGVVFYEYFAPIPFETIAFVLAVIESCIDEWSDGTWKESKLTEERYKAIYVSHLNTLRDLHSHGQHQQGGDLLAQIQNDLLKEARIHAGAPPEPITGAGRLPIATLDSALQEYLPAYPEVPGITVSSE